VAAPRAANISIDFESIYYYSETLGLGHPDRDSGFERIVERFLDLFAELDVAATFFIVGDDIRLNKLPGPLLRRMAAAGHELANHTMSHPFNLSRLPRARKEEEVLGAGRIIEDATGQRVVGFRAPCLDVDEEIVEIIEAHGYTYESSVLPFYFKQVQELAYGLLTRGQFRSTGAWQNSFASGDPYVPAQGGLHRRGSRGIVEVPIATVPFVRFPFYSTIHFAFGRAVFDASYALLRRSRRFFTYELHSIDLAGCDEDGLEARYPGIGRHPCLKHSVGANTEFLRYVIGRFRQDYVLSTLRDMVDGWRRDAGLPAAG
jgi:peptidoglycan-N-acetylglucosamine deacetylase